MRLSWPQDVLVLPVRGTGVSRISDHPSYRPLSLDRSHHSRRCPFLLTRHLHDTCLKILQPPVVLKGFLPFFAGVTLDTLLNRVVSCHLRSRDSAPFLNPFTLVSFRRESPLLPCGLPIHVSRAHLSPLSSPSSHSGGPLLSSVQPGTFGVVCKLEIEF